LNKKNVTNNLPLNTYTCHIKAQERLKTHQITAVIIVVTPSIYYFKKWNRLCKRKRHKYDIFKYCYCCEAFSWEFININTLFLYSTAQRWMRPCFTLTTL